MGKPVQALTVILLIMVPICLFLLALVAFVSKAQMFHCDTSKVLRIGNAQPGTHQIISFNIHKYIENTCKKTMSLDSRCTIKVHLSSVPFGHELFVRPKTENGVIHLICTKKGMDPPFVFVQTMCGMIAERHDAKFYTINLMGHCEINKEKIEINDFSSFCLFDSVDTENLSLLRSYRKISVFYNSIPALCNKGFINPFEKGITDITTVECENQKPIIRKKCWSYDSFELNATYSFVPWLISYIFTMMVLAYTFMLLVCYPRYYAD